MKIDRTRLRKGTSEIPPECQVLIERLRQCSRTELLEELSKINTWTFGKCELYHWIGVLDIFDSILEEATQASPDNKWVLGCDTYNDNSDKKLLLWTLHFTTLLIEHSFSRHLYNSMEHLLALMSSSDMNVVLAVLNLLYMFSKRSNFITRLASEKRQALLLRLHYLAESWGGKENGFGLADCCIESQPIPHSATTLHFEIHKDYSADKDKDNKDLKGKQNSGYIHVENVDKLSKTPAEIMKGLCYLYYVPADKEMWLFTHVRLAHHFANYSKRLLCVQARLQALSVLVYSNALQDSVHALLYNGLLEELVELVELEDPKMVEIRSAALRTLTSIIHLDRNPHFPKKPGSRLHNIIDVTGANQYHGFLPTLVRNCISLLTKQIKTQSQSFETEKGADNTDITDQDDKMTEVIIPLPNSDYTSKFPLPLATALFSFLYHLASYEAGGEALVSCGMMESLLQVINWHGVELEHITFVTRAVRVIDLITNIDMQAFHSYGGLQSFINRLDVEVSLCLKEQSYEFKLVEQACTSEVEEEGISNYECVYNAGNAGKTCLPQRAALLKSMLNFLKKALQDTMFAENVRHVMEGILPTSLKHIIANAEYYGPSLFLLATDLVTVYVFQEPTLLSTLQDNGLTDVILHALLTKDVPATREVLGSLPNVFSALCLNARGLQSFVKRKPFERLLKVLISPQYLSAMRRRRSSDPLGDTASNLGNAMDELMRHQPSLKSDATAAIIKLLNDLCQKGSDPKYICWRPHSKSETSPINIVRSSSNAEGSSDEEDDDEEEASTSSHNAQNDSQEATTSEASEKTPIALVDYILNIMKFIDAILSNNSTDDHCREFVLQSGLEPLLRILGLPNLPIDCPVTVSAQAVASVCKSILNLAHEPQVLKQGLSQLNEVLQTLKPLYSKLDSSSSSKLLHELASAPHLESAFNNASATPLLHAMAAALGYVIMFVHVCRTGQSEIRLLSLQHWGSEDGLSVLKGLAELYTSLVWESTLLLALCSDDAIPLDCDFGKEDMEKLNIPVFDRADSSCNSTCDTTANVASALEGLSTNPTQVQSMEIDGEPVAAKPSAQQLKYIKPLLGASSKLGRALAELFGLLVKLCVGTPVRQRRGQSIVSTPAYPSPFARSVATTLNFLLAHGLNYDRLPQSPVPKFKLTFLICSVGFTSPMLFDEKRYPYHLMLQMFSTLGGQGTFFSTFRWALSAANTIDLDQGLEHPELPEGTGEFLDAWLLLLEKMVNPKAILDSPHSMNNKATPGMKTRKLYMFNPLGYLIQIHKLAFEAVMLMWGKKPLPSYGVRMTESILSILRHILRGEKIIKERLNKGEDKTATSSSTTARPEIRVNQESLRQLMDMGFSCDHSLEALTHCLNVELATDYLLSNPPHLSRPGTSGMDVDEDDQVIQAIAQSLNESVPTLDQRKRELEEEKVPLAEELIDNFTHGALQVCLELVEMLPETVYKVCELLGTIMKRNGPTFRDELLDKLLGEIKENCENILENFKCKTITPELLQELCDSKKSLRLGCYTHLYTLFFEVPSYFDMRVPCGFAVYRAELVQHFIQLIALAERFMTETKKTSEPKWLTPILLLLDSLGKVSICTQRKRNMHLVTNRIWKWYDLVTGKWTPYSATNNKLINDSYWNGEQSIRVTCGRRRYTITFGNMLQCNDETGNNRPISMTPINLASDAKYDPKNGESVNEPMEIDEVVLTEKEDKRCIPAPSLTKEQTTEIVTSCVKLMHLQIDKDLLHALMRICLRLTRDFDNAKVFVQEGGIKCLLKMRQTSAFSGYGPLATVLIRHTLEEPQTLAHSIEKVIRGRALPSIPPPYRELMYLARQIGGAVARSPDTFFEVAKSILRVDCTIFRRPEDLDARLPVRAEPMTRTQTPQMEEEVSVQVIFDLLYALLQPLEFSTPETSEIKPKPSTSSTSTVTRETMYQRASDLLGSNSASHEILNDIQDMDSPVTPITRVKITRTPSETALDTRLEQELVRRPMLAKHCILKILADAVVSYGAIAKLITDFNYKAGCNDIITEDCTALAFMFDKLLPVTDNISDRDCSMMCRVLIAAISSCNHCPDAQSVLVSEVKSALGRSLLMPESFEKHNQVQLITGIITTMIENCPPSNQLRVFKNQSFNGQINNIVKLMLRKGLFNDLARISHYLDLSSPNFSLTVNSSLKPMEALSRIVNQPISGTAGNRMNKKSQQSNLDDTGATQSGATSTEATNAQGEEAIEDAENTEHDISAVASSLEANPDVTAVHEETDTVLEHIMDQLLDHGTNETNRSYSEVASGRNHHTMDIDDDALTGYEHEPDATEELMSTDSGDSDSNASDQEVEDEDNDDNEVDDDDVDEGEDNDDNNYENEVNSETFDASTVDLDEDILMIQYADHEVEDTLPMVRWNENGFTVPLFDGLTTVIDQPAPASHPLLVARHNSENGTTSVNRTQRTNRARRYQYLQLNARSSNPPVILQRLLGPVAQNLSLSTNEIMNSPVGRDTTRVVVMDNFSLIPTNEEQIDFVDQSGYLFGPSLAATLNHVPSVLHWWNEESKLLDIESTYDITIYICNKLIPNLMKFRNTEIAERKQKKAEEDKSKHNKTKVSEAPKKSYGFLGDSNFTMSATNDSSTQRLSTTVLSFNSAGDNAPAVPLTDSTSGNDSDSSDCVIIPSTEASDTSDQITVDTSGGQTIRNSSERDNDFQRNDDTADENLLMLERSMQDHGQTLSFEMDPFSSPSVGQHLESNVPEQGRPGAPPQNEPERTIFYGGPSFNSALYTSTIPFRDFNRYDIDQGLRISIAEMIPPELPTNPARPPTQETTNYSNPNEQYDDPSDDQSLTDNLSEVERVASEGLSERRLQNSAFSYSLEPFEEPSDTPSFGINSYANSTPNESLMSTFSFPTIPSMPRRERLNERMDGSPDLIVYDYLPMDHHVSVPHAHQTAPNTTNMPQPLMHDARGICVHEGQNIAMPHPSGLHSCTLGPRPCMLHAPLPCPTHPIQPFSHGQHSMYIHPSIPSAHTGMPQIQPPIPPPMPLGNLQPLTHMVMHPPPVHLCQNIPPTHPTNPQNLTQIQNTTSAGAPLSEPTLNQDNPNVSMSPQSESDQAPISEPNEGTNTTNPNTDVIMQVRNTRTGESGEEIPDGVDPSFLEALPPEMRREVLEQYRILYSGPSSSGNGEPSTANAVPSEVNPEFLAALPPAIQEEVLTQQRLEQQRQAAAHANPDEPVDAGAFFETLQPSLRTMILADMEDSQMSVLPPDLAAEAQTLRRDWEARNRQMVQERFFQSSLPTIIRHSARGRLSSRLNTQLLPQRAQWSTWGRAEVMPNPSGINAGARVRGRQLLDHESLSCLLVLLFADDPKLNNLRLHRVIRNLCYHGPTRDWIIKALLSIIDKSVHSRLEEPMNRPTRRAPKPGPLTSKLLTDVKNIGNGANWLNIRMEAALGCHANVFIVNRAWGKRSDRTNHASIVIHPQAAPIVCKNSLDLFITLSRNFPTCLLPLKMKEEKDKSDKEDKSKSVVSPSKSKNESTDFWEMLLKLDSSSSKKGKSLAKAHSNLSLCSESDNTCTSFDQSAFGQLLCMLSSPVIYRSSQLTDRLLRLLSVITTGMPELSKSATTSKSQKPKLPQYESVSAPESALNLAVNVLTYKSCSEEGLEDATNLLLNLSNCSIDMSYVILSLLLNGAKRIGEVVREQIQSMLHELQKLNKVQKRKLQEEATPSSSRGTIANRFTKETVIITASSKIKASYDLQLPCMAPLTSKTSSQLFFLRVLRVIVQIREAIKKGLKKEEELSKKKTEESSSDKTEETVAQPAVSEIVPQHSHLAALSDQLNELETLWETLSMCLFELEHTPDDHAVLVLQPAVEAFFLVHSPQQGATDREVTKTPNASQEVETTTQAGPSSLNQSSLESEQSGNSDASSKPIVPADQLKFLNFAEKHRTVLNQILRQTTAHLSDGPFSVLVDHTKVLDFDVKRKYFRTELERLDQGLRREETAIHVRRSHVFEDSFRELYRRTPEEWKNRFYIVFEEEEGQDAGGLLREWYMIISRDIFNPMYALFTISPGDRVTYMINPASHYNPNHLCYYKFVGRVIAKAIYDNKLLECYFTRSFYKHILGIPVKYTDMESEDYSFYRGLVYLLENNINDLGYDLTFSTEINEFGVTETRDLIPDGRNVAVTEENKLEYIRLSCQMKMTGAIRQQLNAFLEGFYDIIPKRLISIFNEQELELLISGLPNVDIDDLKTNTEYHKYQSNSLQIQWFWRALRSFDQADRAKFLQFVTGTSKVPLQGFANLEGMNGVQKFQIHRDDRSTDRLPSAHTCFNQLDLPVYETSEKLHTYLLKAIHECSEGFGFA